MIDSMSYVDAARFQSAAAADRKITGAAANDSAGGSRSFSEVLNATVNHKPGAERQKQKLMEACRDMESLFVAKMLKEMRNSVPKNEWIHGGQAEEIFEDMLYDEYSKSISNNSNLGIANMLYRELSAKL